MVKKTSNVPFSRWKETVSAGPVELISWLITTYTVQLKKIYGLCEEEM